MTKQVELARDFAVKMKDEKAKQDLLKDAAALEQITPKIIQATKDALNDKNNSALKNKVYDLVSEARDINQRINVSDTFYFYSFIRMQES